ncbi:hypothetical protein CXF68_18705 [Tenacibaculum sp. Bg11-29]|uniref:hypothetical protein n=1 Tax=Tenacibaculum sp. Bg11-29 TaxID=2058306 RepID=UPI000C347D58|nr:hypothetical protein [Tenacibaculum sp. Bg11-29]PKH52606.1 hypothetical protein CXF68_18705 [Tenacibaculum sp. Bg11-29]
MKKIIFNYIPLLLLFLSCNSLAESDLETLKIEDFNWTVNIPENFKPINKEEWNKTLTKGINAIENTFEQEVENQAVTIFTYKNGQFNNFEANWQPFDFKIDGDYLETYSGVNKMIYQTIETQMPDAKLDSVSSTQKVNGLKFQRFDISIDLPNGIKMRTIGFSRLFNKKEFTMNITSVDEKIEQKMLDAFLNSKFE